MPIRIDSSKGSTVSGIILYDEEPSARRALKQIRQQPRRSPDRLRYLHNRWPFEALSPGQENEAIMAKAVVADFIMIGLRPRATLPPHLQAWLQRWSMRRKVNEAVVILVQPASDASRAQPSTTEQALMDLAVRYGLGFFHVHHAGADEPATAHRPRTPAVESCLR